MLTLIEKRNIEEQVEKDILAQIEKGKNKVAKKSGKKGFKKVAPRTVILDRNIINTFNARVAALGVSKQLRGNVGLAEVDIENVKITLTRLDKKKETDVVRYEVKGGHGKDFIAPKKDAVACLSERIVIETNKIQ